MNAASRCWSMKRRCALTPRQLLFGCATVCAVGAPAGIVFGMLGYPLISAMVAIEWLAFTVAVIHHVRHACDAETLILQPDGRLRLEARTGERVSVVELRADRTRVRPQSGPAQLVSIEVHGRCAAHVGRHIRPAQRRQLANELNAALRNHSVSQAGAALAAEGAPTAARTPTAA